MPLALGMSPDPVAVRLVGVVSWDGTQAFGLQADGQLPCRAMRLVTWRKSQTWTTPACTAPRCARTAQGVPRSSSGAGLAGRRRKVGIGSVESNKGGRTTGLHELRVARLIAPPQLLVNPLCPHYKMHPFPSGTTVTLPVVFSRINSPEPGSRPHGAGCCTDAW